METRTVLQAKRLGIVSCRGDELLRDIVVRMADDDISGMVVVDDSGGLQGIITRSDLLSARLNSPNWRLEPVSAYMTWEVVSVSPETLLSQVVAILLERHIHRVVVVREEAGKQRPIAVLSISDLVCEMAAEV